MYLYKYIFVGLVFLFFVKQTALALPHNLFIHNSEKGILPLDSNIIKISSPNKEKEEKIFADSKLKYKYTLTDEKGVFQRFIEWLAEKLFGNIGFENVSAARKIILWTIFIGAMALLIWLLSRSELVSLIKPKPKATGFNFMDVTEDLDKINFNEKIKNALKAEDYRLATRWNYLKILFLLDSAKLIQFESFKTNIDYKYELKNKQFQKDFITLSYIYDYVWYGKFDLDKVSYYEKETEFKNFENGLSV